MTAEGADGVDALTVMTQVRHHVALVDIFKYRNKSDTSSDQQTHDSVKCSQTVCSCCSAPHLSRPWCSRVPGDTSSCTARCRAAGTARTGSPSLGPCCSSTRTWSHCSCWWTTAGTWSAGPHCSRSPSCCLKGKEKTSKTSECLELDMERSCGHPLLEGLSFMTLQKSVYRICFRKYS